MRKPVQRRGAPRLGGFAGRRIRAHNAPAAAFENSPNVCRLKPTMDTSATSGQAAPGDLRSADHNRRFRVTQFRILPVVALLALAAIIPACQSARATQPATPKLQVEPFNFQVSYRADTYQIEGYLSRPKQPGRLPALLVVNVDQGNSLPCINQTAQFTATRMQGACICIPGSGRSPGPTRSVGPPR